MGRYLLIWAVSTFLAAGQLCGGASLLKSGDTWLSLACWMSTALTVVACAALTSANVIYGESPRG